MNPEPQIYDEAFYHHESQSSLRAAMKILPLLLRTVNAASALDVGCGAGMFLRVLSELGVKDVLGVDGNYVPVHLRQIKPEQFREHDLTKPLQLGRRFDLVLSLEVAEHIAGQYADGFVDLLCSHGDVVLFSAAIPGQGGTNHINEQWPDYWAAKFKTRGYNAVDIMRPLLWNDGEIDFWYRQNMLVFSNAAGLARNETLKVWATRAIQWNSLNLVHPEQYASKQAQINGLAQTFDKVKVQLEEFQRRTG